MGCTPKVVPPSPTPDLSVSAVSASWYLQGRVAFVEGDQRAAGRALEWTTRTAPNNPYAHVAWGDFLREQGEVAAAYAAYQNALLLAGLPTAHLGIGLLYLSDEDYVLAESHLRAAVQGKEVSGYPALMVAVQAEYGDEQALLTLAQWTKEGGVDPEDRLLRIDMALALERPDAARDDAIWLLNKRAYPDLGDILLTAVERSCSIGVVWRWMGNHLYLNEDVRWQSFVQRVSELSNDERFKTHKAFPVGAVGKNSSERVDPIAVEDYGDTCDSDPYVLLGRSIATCEALPVFERAVVVEPLNLEALALLVEGYDRCGFEAAAKEVSVILNGVIDYQRGPQ
jgi:tetratricopeptide (TPR) repeat protein